MCSGGSCIQAVHLAVLLSDAGTSATTQRIYFDVRVTNTGTSAIPISSLTVRYWYTWEGSGSVAQTFITPTYFLNNSGMISLPASGISGTFASITPVTGADHYLQLTFASSDGNLAPGTYMEFGVGMLKNDNSNYTQTGDYSFNGSNALVSTTKATVYLTTSNGTALVYGTEPM